MSNTEPDASGSMNFSNQFNFSIFGGRRGGGGGGATLPSSINIPGLAEATAQLTDLNQQLKALGTTLTQLSSTQQSLAGGLNNMLKGIQANATAAAGALGTMTAQVGGSSQGAYSQTIGTRPAGINIPAILGSALNSDILKDIAMFPLRFMQTTIGQNRNLTMATNVALGGTQFATGTTTPNMMRFLGGMPGNVMGGPEDIINLIAAARQYGAIVDPNQVMAGIGAGGGMGFAGGSNRAAGFFSAVRQAQAMTPGTPVGQLAGTIGGFSGSPAQQQAAFMTGGAFAMIGPGGSHKTLSQWAESVLRWLENQRPSGQRGPFTYGELLTQYFPGSNIDAWFAVNGVPPDMREMWWNYALAKARSRGDAGTGGGPLNIGGQVEAGGVAFQRLRATTATTRGGFQLGGQMAGAYANREVANRWFNEMMAETVNRIVPSQIAGGPLRAMQFMPDPMEELMMAALERMPNIMGSVLGGTLGWLGGKPGNIIGLLSGGLSGIASGLGVDIDSDQLTEIMDLFFPGASIFGDVGDIGDPGVAGWGSMGGSTTAGLHPDVGRKVGAMMQANPRLRINSGLRNTVQQQNLRRGGHSHVSGKPSAHTRGLAADLGPPSQYGWIVNNASKFGLKSGVGVGEPWHVGIGDDPAAFDLGNLFSLFSGQGSQENLAGSVGALIPMIFRLFLGGFAGTAQNTAADEAKLAFLPGLYGVLRKATPRGIAGSPVFDTFGGGEFPGGGGPVSGTQMERAIVAAKAAAAAGFTGSDLFMAVSIAGRESGGWNPRAYNGNTLTGDQSYGLMQINMLGNLGPSRRAAYGLSSNEDLFDPYTNMRVAHAMEAGRSTPFYDWGPYKGEEALYSTEGYQGTARAAITAAGVGDVEQALASGAVFRGAGGHVHFQNTFVINGGGGAGGGGVDVRRTVTMIADQLENEMKRRLARRN